MSLASALSWVLSRQCQKIKKPGHHGWQCQR